MFPPGGDLDFGAAQLVGSHPWPQAHRDLGRNFRATHSFPGLGWFGVWEGFEMFFFFFFFSNIIFLGVWYFIILLLLLSFKI